MHFVYGKFRNKNKWPKYLRSIGKTFSPSEYDHVQNWPNRRQDRITLKALKWSDLKKVTVQRVKVPSQRLKRLSEYSYSKTCPVYNIFVIELSGWQYCRPFKPSCISIQWTELWDRLLQEAHMKYLFQNKETYTAWLTLSWGSKHWPEMPHTQAA